ncbi:MULTISPECIES: hypothetical protein [Paenibacillus]|uniref:Uncharacterized protein n=1 Tax=Paenibacillus albilobatus TaxID=2716884 RepID=A0A920CF31_9BACL|nr:MULTISPECIES: hypothetical protein [Paenibacillus]GIO34554.1 hypothetical protein J2TS6_56950 [Paenibacillus albilobatus]
MATVLASVHKNNGRGSRRPGHRNKNKRKPSKESRANRFWFGLLKAVGFVVVFGCILAYWNTTRLTSIILNARPVEELTADTTGMVRLEGTAEGAAAFTDEGKLRKRYALLQKEEFNWHCSRGGCSYELNEDQKPSVWGTLKINGVSVESDEFRFYADWLPLDITTVPFEQLSNIKGPLLVEKPKSTAYGYYAVSPGDRVTVIGQAQNGRLEPFELPGEDERRVILIGSSVDRMVSHERKNQIVYLILGAVVALMLLPVVVGWIRKLFRRFART